MSAGMKLKVLTGVTAAGVLVLGVVAAALAVGSGMFGPRFRQVAVAVNLAPQPPPAVVAGAKAQLEKDYALPPGQDMRVVKPPLPAGPRVWADAEFPYAKGAANIPQLGFRARPDGAFDWRYMSYSELDLNDLVRGVVPWYRVDGIEQVKFPPQNADLVVRDGLNYQQTLEAGDEGDRGRDGRPLPDQQVRRDPRVYYPQGPDPTGAAEQAPVPNDRPDRRAARRPDAEEVGQRLLPQGRDAHLPVPTGDEIPRRAVLPRRTAGTGQRRVERRRLCPPSPPTRS
jgi:hypothetical protein